MDQEQKNQSVQSGEEVFDISEKKFKLFDVVFLSTLFFAFKDSCLELLRDIIKLPDVVYGPKGRYISAQIDNLTGIFDNIEGMRNEFKKNEALMGREKVKEGFDMMIKELAEETPWGSLGSELFEKILSLALKQAK